MAAKYDLTTFTAEAWGIKDYPELTGAELRNRHVLDIRDRLTYHHPRHEGYRAARCEVDRCLRKLDRAISRGSGEHTIKAADHSHLSAKSFSRAQSESSGLNAHGHEVWRRIFGDTHAETVDQLSADGLRENLAEIKAGDPKRTRAPYVDRDAIFRADILTRLDRFLDFLEVQFGDVQAVASDDD